LIPKRFPPFFLPGVFLLVWLPAAFGQSPGENCLPCHGDRNLKSVDGRQIGVDAAVLEASIHGRAGLECVDCHGDMAGVKDFPHAPNPRAVDCSGCHGDVADLVRKSRHGGKAGVPSCQDCHGNHGVGPSDDPSSSVHIKRIYEACGRCHGGQTLPLRSGFPSSPSELRAGSFHGIALKLGEMRAAHCVSCHGHHDVRSPSDPRSPVHPGNLPSTCGTCHPGVGANVSKGRIHPDAAGASYIGPAIAEIFYAILIGGLSTIFLAFIASDLWRRWRER